MGLPINNDTLVSQWLTARFCHFSPSFPEEFPGGSLVSPSTSSMIIRFRVFFDDFSLASEFSPSLLEDEGGDFEAFNFSSS